MDRGEIISLAFALGQNIAESDELAVLRAKQAEVMEDADSFKLLQAFEELRSAAVDKMQNNEELTEDEQAKLHAMEDEMFANEKIKHLYDLQETFNNMMNAVYYAIDQAVSGGSGCGGGCDSCGSGCS